MSRVSRRRRRQTQTKKAKNDGRTVLGLERGRGEGEDLWCAGNSGDAGVSVFVVCASAGNGLSCACCVDR